MGDRVLEDFSKSDHQMMLGNGSDTNHRLQTASSGSADLKPQGEHPVGGHRGLGCYRGQDDARGTIGVPLAAHPARCSFTSSLSAHCFRHLITAAGDIGGGETQKGDWDFKTTW